MFSQKMRHLLRADFIFSKIRHIKIEKKKTAPKKEKRMMSEYKLEQTREAGSLWSWDKRYNPGKHAKHNALKRRRGAREEAERSGK